MIRYYEEIEQGSEEWFECRRGLLTASEMRLIITPAKLQYASNDKERSHLYELAAQRITGYVEPTYVSDDMLRGHVDEIEARKLYSAQYAPVRTVGFMTNDKWGFTIGYSPDALVGDEGQMEAKSRRQKYQVETILEKAVPSEHVIQVQTGLLTSERQWSDYVSYCAGLPMLTLRVYPDPVIQTAIVEAAATFDGKLQAMLQRYGERLADPMTKMIPTERKLISEEITV